MTRTITTVEELDALPIGTVIRAKHGTIIERDEDGTAYIVGNNWPVFWLKSGLPATVLYQPGEQEPRPLPDREQVARAIARAHRQAIEGIDVPVYELDHLAADAVLKLFQDKP